MNKQPVFNAADVANKFKINCIDFDKILAQANHPEFSIIRSKLRNEVKKYRESGIITVAFVGQYNAGKSTTISALTGRRDIKIDSDIATDLTTIYDWNGIKLIDTPGLFTDRKDHDAITYEAINKADLLIFSLTYMLFDSITVENFKKLAYEKGYRWKMMLLINKMSDEAGEEAQKITNYRKSLAEALHPYSTDEFPVCFIDAKDYCDGVDEGDDFLLEISRFQSFIDSLNNFVERRAALARFDTPVRIVLASVDEAQLNFTRNSNQDATFLELLTRLSRIVRKERERLRTKFNTLALEVSSRVVKEGIKLAYSVGTVTQEEFEQLIITAEFNVQKYYDTATEKLKKIVEEAVEDISQEVKKVLQSDLTQTFINCLKNTHRVSTRNIDNNINFERLQGQVEALQKIGDILGVHWDKFTAGRVASGSQGFLNATNVAGSNLHHVVYGVGKFVGVDFKPWQAVGIAKDLANFTMFLGPVLSVVGAGLDAHSMQQETERQDKMAEARQDIRSQFVVIAKNLENQIEKFLAEVELQVYGELDRQIVEARQQEESAIAASNTWVKQLADIRHNFESILRYISKVRDNTEI
ncbi:50S ribosome-binding GTPase [Nostocaceae cyanobacterium CENA369]|uniref:50S ribosome-binding GTPase n=1 Tax=Dendronalium phyllosphericum CENA369 TaxID=1725256 RepID=A0A8J7LGJ3_9NOST|nr:GTPase [Dendronalium phyllosphericum]MBH8573039.1 50S ribosome-binding GTPase [Dendronalium phyllosphericum CENA369]